MENAISPYVAPDKTKRQSQLRAPFAAVAVFVLALAGIGAAGLSSRNGMTVSGTGDNRSGSSDARQPQGPTVKITPGSESVFDRMLEVTVMICSPYPNSPIASRTFTLSNANGANSVADSFSDVSAELGQPASCNGPDDDWQWWRGTLLLALGENTLTVTAFDGAGYAGSDQVSYVRPSVERSVLIMASAQTVERTASQPGTARFTVMNTGAASTTYTISSSCTGMGSCGSPSPSSLSVGAGQTGVTTVAYTAPGTVGAQGLITITATNSTPSIVSDQTWTEVNTVAAPSAGAVLAVTGVGGSDVLERSLCLTVSAGSALAVECGELRALHALPMVRTLNTERVPMLLYNSEHAHPMPIVHADVTLPSGEALPTTVEATLTVNGAQVTKSWNGTDWVAGETRRVAVQVDAGGWSTGLYPFTLEIRRVTGGSTVFATLSGNLPVVNRTSSPLGAGWWMAGLEQLINPGDGTRFWVGGDGSTRRYSSAGANLWIATAIDRVDSLSFDGTYYFRLLPNKVKVKFDASGQHVGTINRLGYETVFAYTTAGGRTVLSTMDMPVLSGTTRYTFNYNGSGQLTSVNAPHPSGSGSRTTIVTPDATTGRIAVIKEPSGDSVMFGYDATVTTRMISRTDRRGFQTVISYNGGRVASHTLTLAGGATVTQSYLLMETAGLLATTRPTGQPLDSLFTNIDGPRTDAADVTRVWFTRFGAVSRTRNPVGRETLALYGNATFPALPTRVRDPNRFVTEAFYNGRGLVDSVRALDPLGGLGNAKTTYQWHASFDFPTRILSPLGTNNGSDTQFAYDATTGNRLWQETGRDSTRVDFRYYSNGLLRAIQAPSMTPDSIDYDATRGNLSYHRAPNLAVTSDYTDAVGRDTLVTIPIDTSHTGQVRNVYDIMDRITKTVNFGPAITSANASADSVVSDQVYDSEGNLTSVSRSRGAYWPGYAPLQEVIVYDGAGRKTSEQHPGRTDDYVYDPAGNVTTHTTALGSTTFTYDPANRLLRRIVPAKTYSSTSCSSFISTNCTYSFPTTGAGSVCIPADTAFFGYDAASRIIRADNGRARVRRSYKPNGLLAHDTLRLRTYYSTGSSPCEVEPNGNGPTPGAEWILHNYLLQNSYDLDGRRTQLATPTSTISYTYDGAGRGLLTGVSESGFTTSTLAYDAAGRVNAINAPGGASDGRSYASSGFLSARTVTANSGAILADTLTYDRRGLMMSARTAYRRGQPSSLTAVMAYTGLGALAIAANDALLDGQAENFRVDAIGNRLRISRAGYKPSDDSDFLGVRFMSYDPYARLTQVVDSVTAAPDNYDLVESYQYDLAGVLTLQYTKEWIASSGTLHDATKSYPSIDDKLSVVNRQIGVSAASDESHAGHHAVYQENWYDALGRRVLVRAQKAPACNSTTFGEVACKSFVERTVWDGDQVLIERRADGASGLSSGLLDQETTSGDAWGEVISLHANGIDAPIAVRKTGRTTLMPYANWKGDYEIGTTADGTPTPLCSGTSDCPLIEWPGSQENADGLLLTHAALNTWWGSLINEKTDASGLKYMRNRYYNPQTGQFTQSDPIGLAGGLNLYGFAAGDPVNYSDPFGLCPKDAGGDGKAKTLGDCPEGSEGRRQYISGKAESNSELFLFLFGGLEIKGGEALGGGAARLISRISESPSLIRAAGELEGAMQTSIDRLTAKLAQGNLNPGIGNRFLFNGIFEARARDGARVYFRNIGSGAIEILAKSTKRTQAQVIKALERLYK
jgi:RHS repeat-associated protein